MSVALMAEVWRMDLPTTDKMVLLALADAANDDGVAWPAVSSAGEAKLPLCRKTSLSERAVQGAIRRLEKGGFLECRMRPGRSTVYLVRPAGAVDAPDPRSRCTPAADAPPQPVRATPAAAADDPSRNHQYSQKNKSSESARPPGQAISKGLKRVKPHALPVGWEAPPMEALEPAAMAVAQGWPPGAYAAMEEKFRAHARSTGWRKSDWTAAWGKWVLDVAPDVARAVKAGGTFAPSVGGGAAVAADPDGRDSCKQALGIRVLVSTAVGPKTAHAWIRPLDFTVEGNRLVVSHHSAFRLEWVRDHFRSHLLRVAGNLEVVFVVEPADG